MDGLKAGAAFEWSRAITAEDIRRFAELSGDNGRHHLEPDETGRLVAHGLMTASLPTKLGGDLNFMARQMHFEFLRQVFSGDTLRCLGVVDSVVTRPSHHKVQFTFTITNQTGEIVLKGSSAGIISRKK